MFDKSIDYHLHKHILFSRWICYNLNALRKSNFHKSSIKFTLFTIVFILLSIYTPKISASLQDINPNIVSYVNIVPINYANLHEPRIDLRYNARHPWVNVDEKASVRTVIAAVLVNDPDSGPSGETSLSIDHGNDLNHFKLVSTGISNTIQVNSSPLRLSEYNLLIVARDHGFPPKSSNITLTIKVIPNNNQPNPTKESQQNPKPPVTDLMYLGTMLVIIFSALVFLFMIGCAIIQRPRGKKGITSSRIYPSDHSFYK